MKLKLDEDNHCMGKMAKHTHILLMIFGLVVALPIAASESTDIGKSEMN